MGFSGFPSKVKFTPVPNQVFNQILEPIQDLSELKCTLRIIWLLHLKKDYPKYISHAELLADGVLARGLSDGISVDQSIVEKAIDLVVKRGTIIKLSKGKADSTTTIYFLNTETHRKQIEQFNLDEIDTNDPAPFSGPMKKPNIYTLYEDNIGMLNPMIAEELKEAESRFPRQWIEDAVRESVKGNKRNWRYIFSILERWESEGRDDGRFRRDTKTVGYKEFFRR